MTTKLHREGRLTIPISIIIIALIIAVAYAIHLVLGYIFSILGAALLLLIMNFFRNPYIEVVQDDTQILAPCDGKVVVIEDVQDDIYFKAVVTQVSIFMSPFNVHVNRNPIGGLVRYAKYYPGKYLMAFNPKSSQLNEQTYVVAENDKVTIAYKQIAGFLARRIKCYIKEGEQIDQGEEYGFIKYGSRIDLLMPTSCKVKIQLAEKVKAGKTVIAEIG